MTAALVLAGCAKGIDAPDTVPVTGTVLYNGDPVPGAQVTFRGGGFTAFGLTGTDGRFQLTTSADGDGAVPGEKQVTVTKRITAGGGSGPAGAMTMEEAAAAAERGEYHTAPTVESALPERYSDPSSSGLRYTVEASGTNDFKIELTD